VSKNTLVIVLIASVLTVSGCATSMTPSQFLEEFPSTTNSTYFDQPSANKAISNGRCELLIESRKYVSPIGFTVEGDMEYGATGVDEWVQADNGNAYALDNFEWISVGDQGATQLIIYFDTMLCN